MRGKRLNLLEIGVGGYEDSEVGAESLRMWKCFFRKGQVVGLDLCDKTRFREDRIDIRVGDQTDTELLRRLSTEYNGFDIIIDDGSHLNEHVIKTFGVLFPLLRPNGIYAIEDIQTSYWPTWGGGIDNPRSSMAYFKGLIDGLNHVEYPVEGYAPSYFDQNIVEMSFFHNLIIIRKGDNIEKSNSPKLIQHELEASEELPQPKLHID